MSVQVKCENALERMCEYQRVCVKCCESMGVKGVRERVRMCVSVKGCVCEHMRV